MKYLLSLPVIVTALTLTSLSAYAIQQNDPLTATTINHLTIVSVEVTDLTDNYENSADSSENIPLITDFDLTPIGSRLDQVDLIVDKIINIGQKIWNIIEKGRPIANYSSSKATALPANTTRWDQLESWRAPRSKVVSVAYKNAYGFEVVRFTYRIVLLYGGSVKGIGKYIGYATVEPLKITTAYMYSFNAKTEVTAVYNMGTSPNPLAGMILNINWTVETVLKKSTTTHTFTLDGLGNIAPVNESVNESFFGFSNLK